MRKEIISALSFSSVAYNRLSYSRLATFQCFINMSLRVPPTSVRHGLSLCSFIPLPGSTLWDTKCSVSVSWGACGPGFGGVLPSALYSVKKSIILRCLVGFDREGGKVCLWYSITVSSLLCSLRLGARKALPVALKRWDCLVQRRICQEDIFGLVKFSGPGAQAVLQVTALPCSSKTKFLILEKLVCK